MHNSVVVSPQPPDHVHERCPSRTPVVLPWPNIHKLQYILTSVEKKNLCHYPKHLTVSRVFSIVTTIVGSAQTRLCHLGCVFDILAKINAAAIEAPTTAVRRSTRNLAHSKPMSQSELVIDICFHVTACCATISTANIFRRRQSNLVLSAVPDSAQTRLLSSCDGLSHFVTTV